MTDPRIAKMAHLLVHYSLELKPGQQCAIFTSPLADELTLAVYAAALEAGAHVALLPQVPGAEELFYRLASDAQLDYVSPVRKLVLETFDAYLSIGAPLNTRELSGSDPARLARARKAGAPLMRTFMERSARGELRWCGTVYPTAALAQEAGMSLHEYREFVLRAGHLDAPDPIAVWRQEGERQRRLIAWLKGRDAVVLKGSDIDLRLSIKDRVFVEADGRYNFPDGEIFTGPVETSANGWVRFRYPAITAGQEVTDIELWFEDGRVVKERAGKGQELLTAMLDTDPGARYLGEWGIGTNYQIQRFTRSILFDEKIGGTIHLALGASYPETGGRNQSGVHWDMICDMRDAEITIDGELFYKDGRPVIEL